MGWIKIIKRILEIILVFVYKKRRQENAQKYIDESRKRIKEEHEKTIKDVENMEPSDKLDYLNS
jgi:hypothetical protein